MRIHVNPDAVASAEFGYVEAGEYELRIEDVQEKKGKSSDYLAVRLAFVDANLKTVEEGKVVGGIFHNIMTRADIQGNLRSFVEALGLSWEDFDTEGLAGMTLHAKVKVGKDQDGNLRNEIARYLPAE